MMRHRRTARLIVVVSCVSVLFSACGGTSSRSDGTGRAAHRATRPVIALLLPGGESSRDMSLDRRFMVQKVRENCPRCGFVASDAGGSAATQQRQATAAIRAGASVLVLDGVDDGTAIAITRQAAKAGVHVVAYDRWIPHPEVDFYVAYGNDEAGRLQAGALVERLHRSARVVMIGGPPESSRAERTRTSARRALVAAGIRVVAERPAAASTALAGERAFDDALAMVGKDGFDGVYAVDDIIAAGVIASLRHHGIRPSSRPVTGRGSTLGAVRRVIAGSQSATLYESVAVEAQDAAVYAVALATGQPPLNGLARDRLRVGRTTIPSLLLHPVVLARDNVDRAMATAGFWARTALCAPPNAAACRRLGLN